MTRFVRLVTMVAVAALLVASTAIASAAQGGRIVVVDQSGAPIADAAVAAGATTVRTGADGSVAWTGASGTVVTVSAPGFAAIDVAAPESGDVRVVLVPATLTDRVTVTASRGDARLATPTSTTVLTSAEILTSAAGAMDDLLRYTPGFSLFRRSSSRVANPTTQGVTLRGVSGSGASRTLVLNDGVPLNDPFGSWVYWNRIPQAAIERVEVLRGTTGDLYGADSLGGVVQVLTFTPSAPKVRAFLEGGSQDTARGSVYGGGRRGQWSLFASGEGVTTAGAYVVAENERGVVDTRADSDYRTGLVDLGWQRDSTRANVRVSGFREERGNGTPGQVNDTSWRQVAASAGALVGGGAFQATFSRGSQDYFQTFTAIAADRASERLTTEQTTPSDFTQASAQWVRSLGRHSLIVGGDLQDTDATVEEFRYSVTNVQTGPFLVGGDERITAGFLRTRILLTNDWTLSAGARVDGWTTRSIDPAVAERTETFFSPRVSLSWQGEGIGAHVAASRAYRTPTLNELHRGFRVGNVVTNPNPALDPERLTSVEAGLLGATGRLSARVTGFYNTLDGAIANITLSSTPAQITRQRANSDEIRAYGAELEADVRASSTLTFTGQLALTSSEFRGSVATPAIEGNRVTQVPAWSAAAGLVWADPDIATLNLQVRASDKAYDDDLNTLVLRRYAVVDVFAGRPLWRTLQLFGAVENLFDSDYDVARTPVRSIGWPRTFRIGVRAFLP
jgi:outer membrane receptor protein involved in Fe transport